MSPNKPATCDVEYLQAFIEIWAINKQHMAYVIGMSEQSMSNKLSPKYTDTFSTEQLLLAQRYLTNMRDALNTLLP